MTTTGPNYSVDNQITFIVQWFRTWSELQKDDFVEVLAQKLGPVKINGLVNGMQNLDTGSRRVSLFSCQVKLFNEWWDTWSDTDKENLASRLKDSDPTFWATLQEELSGTRKKLEDDFFTTINTCISNSNGGTVIEISSEGESNIIAQSNGVNEIENTENGNEEILNGHEEDVDEMEEEDGPSG